MSPDERARRNAEDAERMARMKAHAAAHPLTEQQRADLKAVQDELNAAFGGGDDA